MLFGGRSAELHKLGDSMGGIKDQYFIIELPRKWLRQEDLTICKEPSLKMTHFFIGRIGPRSNIGSLVMLGG